MSDSREGKMDSSKKIRTIAVRVFSRSFHVAARFESADFEQQKKAVGPSVQIGQPGSSGIRGGSEMAAERRARIYRDFAHLDPTDAGSFSSTLHRSRRRAVV